MAFFFGEELESSNVYAMYLTFYYIKTFECLKGLKVSQKQ